MNFLKLYIGDYMRDTGHLSLLEHGAYLLMLQHFCATERPLPKGAALYRLLRASSKAEREAVDSVVSMFWRDGPDGGLVNQRALREIAAASRQREINRALGRRGGRPSRAAQAQVFDSQSDQKTESVTDSITDSVSVAKPNRNRTETLTRHQTPDTRHQTPDTRHQTPDTRHQTPDYEQQIPLVCLNTEETVNTVEQVSCTRAKAQTRGSRLSVTALPDEWRAFCARVRPDLDPAATFERFADYWRAQPGQRGVRVDWSATWRNWCRNERRVSGNYAAAAVGRAAALEAGNLAAADEWLRQNGGKDAGA